MRHTMGTIGLRQALSASVVIGAFALIGCQSSNNSNTSAGDDGSAAYRSNPMMEGNLHSNVGGGELSVYRGSVRGGVRSPNQQGGD